MERKSYLTNKAFQTFLGASILTALSAMLGNIVDGIIVSHLIDYNAMSATSLSKPIIQGNYTFYQLVGLGASILVAKAMGQSHRERVNALFSLTIVVLLVYGLTETMIGICCPGVVVRAICSNASLYDYATQYFTPLLIGTPLFLAIYFLGGFTAIDGAPKLVSKAMVTDNLVNLCMDVVLIKVFDMGVMGSSVATLLGHMVAIGIISTHYLRGKSQYRFTLHLDLSLLREACSTGLPFAVASICMTIYLYSTQSIIGGGLGKDGLFIFSVMLNIMTIYNMFVTGACSTMQQLAALQLGMGDRYGHRITVFTAFKFMNVCLGVACLVLLVTPQLVAHMFDCPDRLLAECCYGVRIYGFAFWLFCDLYLLMVNYKLLKFTQLANFISFTLSLSVIPVMWLDVHYLPSLVWWSNLFAYLLVFLCVLLFAAVARRHQAGQRLLPLFLLPSGILDRDNSLDFSYDYTPESLHRSFDEMSEWLKAKQLDKSVIFKVRVIAEELMSNITRHSEQKDRRAFADVRLVVGETSVTFALTDNGIPFNPVENRDKGYGLMIANGAASELTYKYQFGQNMTTAKVNF